DVVVVRDPDPPFALPVPLNGGPQRTIQADFPALVRQEIRAELSHAGLLQERNSTSRLVLDPLTNQSRVRTEVLDLGFRILQELELPDQIGGLILWLDLLVHITGVDAHHTVRSGPFPSNRLDILHSAFRHHETTRV